jgi:hypothetical protein
MTRRDRKRTRKVGVNEPPFLWRDVTKDELEADLDALRAGRYPGLTFAGDAGWRSTYREDGTLGLSQFKRVWLANHAEDRIVVTLQYLDGIACWRRIE